MIQNSEMRTKNKFSNIEKMITMCEPVYDKMAEAGLINVTGTFVGRDRLKLANGKIIMNMSSCCYLGLNDHPDVRQGLFDGINDAGGVMQLVNAGFRIRLSLQDEVADEFSEFFGCGAWLTTNCAMAALGTLPMLAAGIFTNGERPLMVFDKHAHFCMNYMKANCDDESEVVTIAHNDMDALEDLCKKHRKVAYICESIYSTGGAAPMEDILRLQDQYGMFIYIDEAHGLSISGKQGKGLTMEMMGELNDNTMIITSLSKGFGANGGGLVLFKNKKFRSLIQRYGGPMLWSAPLGAAMWGSARASLRLHKDGTVDKLQKELRRKVEHFDRELGITGMDPWSGVRVVNIEDQEKLFHAGQTLLEKGYYTSTITFPTVKKSDSGLRIMIRTNMYDEEINEFISILKEVR
ncbi:aminotransferase class I/II-fold pyridoxal phosphate-dependent enzyme [Brevibacillus sp. SYSU BS000544]|uniref:aminotransferase class I/II-fold pyridoxal phosphate-dependent enzyme n=1 Tax=Brevibacillus sp. SYSU BS000544 TaxID=3416443 RepID=UPI003CE56636